MTPAIFCPCVFHGPEASFHYRLSLVCSLSFVQDRIDNPYPFREPPSAHKSLPWRNQSLTPDFDGYKCVPSKKQSGLLLGRGNIKSQHFPGGSAILLQPENATNTHVVNRNTYGSLTKDGNFALPSASDSGHIGTCFLPSCHCRITPETRSFPNFTLCVYLSSLP